MKDKPDRDWFDINDDPFPGKPAPQEPNLPSVRCHYTPDGQRWLHESDAQEFYERAARAYYGEVDGPVPQDAQLVGLTDELHRRLHVQARNLLFEHRFKPGSARGTVPCDEVERLMRLYGNLIAKLIFDSLKDHPK